MKLKSFLLVSALACGPQALAEVTDSDFPAASSTEGLASSVDTMEKTLSIGRYIGGGLTGLIAGGGLGHAVQGRWGEKGWIFTAGAAATVVGLSGLALLEGSPLDYYFTLNPVEGLISILASALLVDSAVGYALLGIALIGMGIKIWEVIDVWALPSHYKVVKESPFQIQPLAFYDQRANLNLGMALNYKF